MPQMVNAIRCGRWLTIATTRSWCPGSIASTVLPQRRHSSITRSTAPGSAPGNGVTSAHRPWNSALNPASGPEYSVPASGCPGTKCTCSGSSGPTSRMTDTLVLPVSVTIAPGAKCGAISAAIAANAPTGAASITASAPCTAFPRSASTRSAIPSARTRSSTNGELSVATSSSASAPPSLATRATELPISPNPMIASRRNSGSGMRRVRPLRHPGGKRLHHLLALLRRARR